MQPCLEYDGPNGNEVSAVNRPKDSGQDVSASVIDLVEDMSYFGNVLPNKGP